MDTSFTVDNGFNLIDLSHFGGADNSDSIITSFTVTTSGSSNMDYAALEPMTWGKPSDPVPTSGTTSSATSVESTTATLNGYVIGSSGTSNNFFMYSTSPTLATGVTLVAATPATSSGSSATSFSKVLTGLTPHTTYYFRAASGNCNDTSYGTIQSFTANPAIPHPLL